MSRLVELWPRIAAFVIDLGFFALYALLLAILSFAGLRQAIMQVFPTLFEEPLAFDLLAFSLLVLPFTLYYTLLEQSPWQGTIGKRIMKLKVVTAQGSRIGFARSLVRNAFKFLPWQLAHTAVFHIMLGPESAQPLFMGLSIFAQFIVLAYVLYAIFNKHHQSIYDRIADTYVVN